MGQERVLRTFILAVIGMVVFILFKPVSPDPMENSRARKTWFFLNKTHQAPVYDCVIVGDSRGLRGISPSIMEEELPGLEIFNFSFHAGGMNPEMYVQAEKMLDPSADKPMILLATTSLSFQPWKRANDQYHEYAAKPRDQVWMYLKGGPLSDWFQSVAPGIYAQKWLGLRPTTLLHEDFQADGWIASDQQPWDDYSDLTEHRQKLKSHRADPGLMKAYVDQTRAWTERGIRVFGFIHPSNPPTLKVEDTILEFDQVEFSAAFEAAGGIWLKFSAEGYDTYDGSHLTEKSARRFSVVLAQAIGENLDLPTKPHPPTAP